MYIGLRIGRWRATPAPGSCQERQLSGAQQAIHEDRGPSFVTPSCVCFASDQLKTFTHKPRSLAEFEYRYNRRCDLAALLPRLGWATARTPPMP